MPKGLEIRYTPSIQLPRSTSLQRRVQNGRHLEAGSNSKDEPQVGHFRCTPGT